jgi:hypothetical protein
MLILEFLLLNDEGLCSTSGFTHASDDHSKFDRPEQRKRRAAKGPPTTAHVRLVSVLTL